ncbi:NfeD family protein [Clostridium sp. SHJSY1]|uniref:NfeD family protein n=1 Tax=Clostridium sp. SHJSY1 TaxID=2942483 RepID=UPI00287551E7|nr:NfeD family protein [Clostridium sp. SHJSY1]MDS0524546.1 NfeD family protein [Clostridium sp. SHJSY1]
MLIFWLVFSIGMVIVDIFTSTFLFVWFAFGGGAAIVANLLGANITIQIIVFGLIGILAVAIGYPWAKKKFKTSIKHTPLMEETYVGKQFTAEEDIEKTTRFKVSGIYWTGSNVGNIIKKGQKFEVVGIDGNKLMIKGIKEENNE